MARRKTGPPAGGQEQQPVRISGRAWEMRPIDSIIPYARNAKIHSADQVARIRGSLREFGFVRPLLIDGAGNLISGHGTLEAARAEGMEAVPCVVVEGLSDTQRRAYIHADNKLAELSSWDEELLGLDLGDLSADGLDLSAYGFDLEQAETYAALIGYQDEVESTVAESQTRTTKMVDCPKCGFSFKPTKSRR